VNVPKYFMPIQLDDGDGQTITALGHLGSQREQGFVYILLSHDPSTQSCLMGPRQPWHDCEHHESQRRLPSHTSTNAYNLNPGTRQHDNNTETVGMCGLSTLDILPFMAWKKKRRKKKNTTGIHFASISVGEFRLQPAATWSVVSTAKVEKC
jgi:hypothetical protein